MKTILAYGLENSTDLFFDLEVLWKSFKYSCHAIPGECVWDRANAQMSDPRGKTSTIVCYMIHETIEHV